MNETRSLDFLMRLRNHFVILGYKSIYTLTQTIIHENEKK